MSPLSSPARSRPEGRSDGGAFLPGEVGDFYDRSLADAGPGEAHGGPGERSGGWRVRAADGRSIELPLRRWCGELSPTDVALLDRCRGPVLDAGCGPGRLVAGLAARGVRCLGVDRSPVAADLAARRGAPVLRRCLFERLPGEGSWATVLLADGNIGIGGDPDRLLRRLRDVVSPSGRIIAEVGAPGSGSGPLRLRLEAADGAPGPWFAWARLALDDVAPVAAAAGLRVVHSWAGAERRFVELARRGRMRPDAAR